MSETFVSHLECSMTGERYAAGELHGLSAAGRPLLVRYDLDRLARAVTKDAIAAATAPGFWRYAPFLPVTRPENRVTLGEVVTPLIALDRTAVALGAEPGRALVKDEGRLPTGSFKARGLGLAVSMAKEFRLGHLAIPTNGNAGAALSAYASRAGIRATVFCPDDTPDINLREIQQHGAEVWKVNGLINDCGRIVAAGREAVGWFDVSTLKEPYRIEGKKTMGLEIAEQMAWRLPDVIVYPTGGGTGLIGMWKAFQELREIGWVDDPLPRMVAVQAEGCAPIVKAWRAGDDHAALWQDAHTIAAGIRVPVALGDFLIIQALRQSGGFAMAVADAAILDARDRVAREEGVLLCPEGAATVAAYAQALADGRIAAGDTVVLFNSASGLKYPLAPVTRSLDKDADIDFSVFSGP